MTEPEKSVRPVRHSRKIVPAGLLVVLLLMGAFAFLRPDAPTTPGGSPGSEQTLGTDQDSGLPWVAADSLPPEAIETLELIDAGGPFPYDKDGSTFGNREGLLPDQGRGHYAEYTVPTPGEGDRGARRIVTGDGGEFYWTADHYESFERIRR
ncbi:MAG: ribonuclease domain-containing protein [Propionibacteriaceae bacterium]